MRLYFFLFLCFFSFSVYGQGVQLGVDVFFAKGIYKKLKNKRIGLITNHTGVDRYLVPTVQRILELKELQLKAVFSPEHGYLGAEHANQKIQHLRHAKGFPIYSLYGKNRRPSSEMLKEIDVLIYDIQCIGSRSYTYTTTLFYAMEEAAKRDIPLIVLDRPNPLSGLIVDGPLMQDQFRSFLGYINIPYCHGMTIGELACFFNQEYQVHCQLSIIKMEGWKRNMSFKETKLPWIPPSPHIPESDTPFYYPTTGILGELSFLNIGVGYTLPFKIVGAPWIDAELFAKNLNEQKIKGVKFIPFHFKPFYGVYKGKNCHGVMIQIIDEKKYRPVIVQYLILGILKSLYPNQFLKFFKNSKNKKLHFAKVNGTDEVYNILLKEKYPTWKLIALDREKRKSFLTVRKKYLFPEYHSF